MIFGEVDVGGVFVPGLLVVALAAAAALFVLRRLLDRLGVYRMVWHRNLFDLALYVVLVSALVDLLRLASL